MDIQHVKNLLFTVYSLEYVALVAYNLVLWLFAMKYWVVAKKVEFFQAEIRFETQAQTFNLVLKSGIVFFTLLTTISVIPEYVVLADAD